ncbi:hypothetical protein [Serratia marcescens]|uniref:hypothetical protein n=1 Tax=Serratia marcescens TaxID=615 RepID=UPI003D031EB4
MCNCHSYNAQAGATPNVEMAVPDALVSDGRHIVCIDACIATVIRALWNEGLKTLSCCCGHGRDVPSVIIPEHADINKYFAVIKRVDSSREWRIGRWEPVFYRKDFDARKDATCIRWESIEVLIDVMGALADEIMECSEDGCFRENVINLYDRADTIFSAENVRRLIDEVRAVKRQANDLAKSCTNWKKRGDNMEYKFKYLLKENAKLRSMLATNHPKDFKLVPIIPTEDMIAAAMDCDDVEFNDDDTFCVNFRNIYAAILAAAPGEKPKC